jgi:tetratricopeptide (TPR) repeat protein
MTEGKYHKVIDVTSKVNNLIEKTRRQAETFGGPSNVYSALMVVCGYSKGMLGDFKEALALCDTALKNAVAFGNTPVQGIAEYYFAMIFLNRGDWETARLHLQNSIAICEKTSFFQWLALAWGGLGFAEAELANPEGGIKFVEKGLKIQRDANIDWLVCDLVFSLAVCHYYSGDMTGAVDLMKEAYRLAENNQEMHYAGKSLIWLGRVTGLDDPHKKNEAMDYIQNGLKILDDLGTKPDAAIAHLFLGELCLSLGRTDQASSFLEDAAEMFEEMGMISWLDKTRAILNKL